MAPVGSAKGGSSQSRDKRNEENHDPTPVSRTGSSSSAARCVHEDLVSIAAHAKSLMDWEAVLLSPRAGPGRWKPLHTTSDFEVYHRQEGQCYSVLAIGFVAACPAEILNLLQCSNHAQFAPKMEAILGDQFKRGEYLTRIDLPTDDSPALDARLAELTVKTVTFSKASWLAQQEQWCYVDGVYRNASSGAVEKLMTPIDPTTVGMESDRDKRLLRSVSCAYLLLPETPPLPEKPHGGSQTANKPVRKPQVNTRVHFYGKNDAPSQVSVSKQVFGSDKIARQRLVKLADTNERLSNLVKRQRLGLQTLVDPNRFLPPTNTPCRHCTKMLLIAKVCRLCGHSVCSDCSKKHERATQQRGTEVIHVRKIRVCACCMERVDSANYENVKPSSLAGPCILPDPVDAPAPESKLRELLQKELSAASSPSRKASVITVIQCLQGLEVGEKSFLSDTSSQSNPASSHSTDTPFYYDDDFEGLCNVHVDRITYDLAVYRTGDDRSYQLDTRDPDSVLNAPMAEFEDERLQAVARVDMDELCQSMELEMLCHLAASEMNCLYSTISIFDLENLNCVGTNVPMFQGAKMPRANTGCAHTILDPKPHLVPHVEADIRFVDAAIVTNLGVQFYFGFPVYGDSDQIIGSFCVMHDKTVDVTESQFSIFQKLADTASKVLRRHIERRQK